MSCMASRGPSPGYVVPPCYPLGDPLQTLKRLKYAHVRDRFDLGALRGPATTELDEPDPGPRALQHRVGADRRAVPEPRRSCEQLPHRKADVGGQLLQA